jgi:hypothetical protein
MGALVKDRHGPEVTIHLVDNVGSTWETQLNRNDTTSATDIG